MGASIIKGLARYKRVWETYLRPFGALNFGIGGDRTEHVLWRVENGEVPKCMKCAVIHCGSNNVDNSEPRDIAIGLASIGLAFRNVKEDASILIHGILPRDSHRRAKIRHANGVLEDLCGIHGFSYIRPASELCRPDGRLDVNKFRYDNLHLVEAGM